MQDTEAVMPVNKKTNVTGIKTGNSGFSINGSKGSKALYRNNNGNYILRLCLFAVIAVAAITIYMIISGAPALMKVGIVDMLFNTVWQSNSGRTFIWYSIHCTYIYYWYSFCYSPWCSSWSSYSCIYFRSCS